MGKPNQSEALGLNPGIRNQLFTLFDIGNFGAIREVLEKSTIGVQVEDGELVAVYNPEHLELIPLDDSEASEDDEA